MPRRKYRRLPNGFGSISKLSGRRRKPFVVRAPAKYKIDEDLMTGCWSAPIIGYAETWEEGYRMLLEIKDNPYDIDKANVTLDQLHDAWMSDHYQKLKSSTAAGYDAAWKILIPYKDRKIKSFDTLEFERIARESCKTYGPLSRYKVLLKLMYSYAIKYKYVTSNPAELIDVASVCKEGRKLVRKRFTPKEVDLLWNHQDDEDAQIALILIYTGLRINEFLEIKRECLHLDQKYLDITDSKTASGIRIVPIADKILPFLTRIYNVSDDSYLLPRKVKRFYEKFMANHWNPLMEKLNMEHNPHEARYTCISMLTEKEVDKRIIKKIVGHKSNDVTERVYTNISLETLLECINKI